MPDFTSKCFRCGIEFTGTLPRVLCPPCGPVFAAEMKEARVKFYLEHPDFPMPGDRVRRRTDDDDAFERDIMADLSHLNEASMRADN